LEDVDLEFIQTRDLVVHERDQPVERAHGLGKETFLDLFLHVIHLRDVHRLALGA
jgi:hypothetical protein